MKGGNSAANSIDFGAALAVPAKTKETRSEDCLRLVTRFARSDIAAEVA